jgi:hypothetical protein
VNHILAYRDKSGWKVNHCQKHNMLHDGAVPDGCFDTSNAVADRRLKTLRVTLAPILKTAAGVAKDFAQDLQDCEAAHPASVLTSPIPW